MDAPEVSDPADDCAVPTGNHYADVTAAWVSDETATGFNVNLQLSKWTADPLAAFTGYTVQFQHQGVQFGVAAFFDGFDWEYDNAFIDVESGEMTGFEDTTGSFTPGSPALLTILFDKAHFPHGDSTDDRLVGFQAATADFKPVVPWGFSPVDLPVPPPAEYVVCDLAEGSGSYVFTVGGHSQHGATGNATAPMGGAPSGNATAPAQDATVEPAAAPDPATSPKDEVPGPAPLLVLVATALAILARRDRR